MKVLHQRTQIRNVLRALLVDKTACGSNIFSNRRTTAFEGDLPALFLWTLDEDADTQGSAPKYYRRKARVIIEAVVEESQNVDDDLDTVCQQVEAVLLPIHRFLKDPVTKEEVSDDIRLQRTEVMIGALKDSMVIGSAAMTFEIEYTTDPLSTDGYQPPPDDTQNFDRASIDYQLDLPGDHHVGPEASDLPTITHS